MSKIVPRMVITNRFDAKIVEFLFNHSIKSEIVTYEVWTYLVVDRNSMCNAITGFNESDCYKFTLLLIKEYLETLDPTAYAVWDNQTDESFELIVWMPPN